MKQRSRLAKYIVVLAGIGILFGIGLQGVMASKDTRPRMIPENFTELAKEARPGVVNIRTVKTLKGGGPVSRHFFGKPFGGRNPFEDFFGPHHQGRSFRNFKQQSLGSGFIIDPEGYIATNNHVIEGADQVRVKLADGKEFDAKIVGRDPKTDLALIKIPPSDDLVSLKMGDSNELPVGTWVVAIGSPFGLEQTVTAGIVSAKGRTIGAGPYDDFIQTDASINPGNSGGPLLNMKGEVIGINTAIMSRSGGNNGIGFAIPTNLAQGVIEQLKNNGEVTRGWLGIGIQDLTPKLKEYYDVLEGEGVLVVQVYKGDPADKGGIKSGDVIIAVDGKKVSSTRELSRAIANRPVGKRTTIRVIRNGKDKKMTVKLAKRQDSDLREKGETDEADELGLELTESAPEMAWKFGFSREERGVLVTHVRSGSKGAQAGILRGDLIKEINHTPVATLTDYRKGLEKAKSGNSVRLLIKRPKAGLLAMKITK